MYIIKPNTIKLYICRNIMESNFLIAINAISAKNDSSSDLN